MQSQQRLSSSLSTVQAVSHLDELNPVLAGLCKRYGLSHMTFLVVHAGDSAGRYPYYCTTYPEGWTRTYLDRGYFDIDPVVDIVRWGMLPVDWASLSRRSPAVHRLFKEARSHDIGPNGLTIPVRGPKGERCLFSVTSHLSKRDWSSLRRSILHDLQVLSYYLHEKVLAVSGMREPRRYRDLSRRERQCLQLLARGLIAKQIAVTLGISERTVRLYLRSARTKVGASTSHHAVARASFLELITI